MIRATALVAPLLTATELNGARHCQRRSRSFIRRVDRRNEVYFEPTKKGNSVSISEEEPRIITDLFEIPNLLLDLDAEDCPSVRPKDERDEQRMGDTWALDPQRVAARETVRLFESKIQLAREGKNRIWRPSQHDILSSALLGSPGTIEDRGSVQDASLRKQLDSIRDTRAKNKIPIYAAKHDVHFIEWLLLRHGKIGQSRRVFTAECLATALHEQKSLRGIRHVVFQALGDVRDLKRYTLSLGFSSDATPSIPQEIRNACMRVCDASPDKIGAYKEVADFVGNLAQRFWENDLWLGAVMYALALRVSAELGSLNSCSRWITFGRKHGTWKHGDQSAIDILGALNVLLKLLEEGASSSDSELNSHAGRQHLLKLMTGVDEQGKLTPDSFRDMSARFLKEEDGISTARIYGIYEAYIRILGKLGAIRTLHFEAKVSSRWVKETLVDSWANPSVVDTLFHEALLSALRVAPVTDDSHQQDVGMSLEECAALDFKSIEEQDRDCWSWMVKEDPGVVTLEESVLALSRKLSFREWLAQVERNLRHQSP